MNNTESGSFTISEKNENNAWILKLQQIHECLNSAESILKQDLSKLSEDEMKEILKLSSDE